LNEKEDFPVKLVEISLEVCSLDDVKEKEEDGWEFARGKFKYPILIIEAIMNAKAL
jgi:hypothetical protein